MLDWLESLWRFLYLISVDNCKAMAAKLFGCKDACVLCIVTKGAPIGHDAVWALAYCDKNHTADAPEYALIAKRGEYIAAMNDTMRQLQ